MAGEADSSLHGNIRMPLALAGVRIIDFTWVTAGPQCTQVLADFGAEVIKVEPPYTPAACAGVNWNNLNRNKRAITLNMRHPDAREIALSLIAKSDVVVENFTPGVLESWGLSWEAMKEANERLVYLSMTGFGWDGPKRGVRRLRSDHAGRQRHRRHDGAPRAHAVHYRVLLRGPYRRLLRCALDPFGIARMRGQREGNHDRHEPGGSFDRDYLGRGTSTTRSTADRFAAGGTCRSDHRTHRRVFSVRGDRPMVCDFGQDRRSMGSLHQGDWLARS